MGLFSRHPAPRDAITSVAQAVQTPPKSLWADGFGRLAVRAVQIIVVVVLVAGIIWGIQQVTLVIIPLVLALIFASAFGPVTMWMRRKGVPAVIATLLTLLAVVVVLAAFALGEGVDDASLIYDLVFVVVLASVIVQGMTIARAAQRLGMKPTTLEARMKRLGITRPSAGSQSS